MTLLTDDTLNYGLSDELILLSNSLRQLLAARGAQEASRRFWAEDNDFDRALWRELAQLGYTAMAGAEDMGGGAASYAQLEIVSEELGRAAAAVPFEMHSLALLTLNIVPNHEEFIPVVAEAGQGTAILTAALDPPALPELPENIPLLFAANGVTGSCPLVLEGAVADAVIVPTTAGMALVRVFRRRHVATLGMNRRANLTFSNSPAASIEGTVQVTLDMARRDGAMLFAARQAGMGDWLLRQTVDYAAERVQFGRAIGSFQAIQHKLAEAHIALTAGRHLVRLAANRFDECEDGFREADSAKAFMAEAMWRATTDAHQIHAGVGFILQHPLHLYFAQSRGAESAFGDARVHHRSAGAAILAGEDYRPNRLLGC